MLQLLVKCPRVGCVNTFVRQNVLRKYCCRKCQVLAKNELVLHGTVISTAAGLNQLGSGMVLVRFGITHPTSGVVRWYPSLKSGLPRPGFALPMINLPYDHLPGSGLYNLAFYGADGTLAFEPTVRFAMNYPAGRESVPFSCGVPWKHQEVPF